MRNKALIESIVGLVVGGSIVGLLYYIIPQEKLNAMLPDTQRETIFFLLTVINGPFVAIFIHELGHLLMGLFQGYQLQLFIVGLLGVHRKDNKIRFFLNRNLQFFGGVAATSPTEITTKIKYEYANILIAGPLFSLVFGFVLVVGSNFVLHSFSFAFAFTGIISLGLFLVTVVPNKSGIFFTDRKRVQRLLNNDRVGEIELAFITSSSKILIENGYRNLSLQDLRLLQSDNEWNVKFWGFYYEYQYQLENGNLGMADKLKAKLILYKDLIPNTLWSSLFFNETGNINSE